MPTIGGRNYASFVNSLDASGNDSASDKRTEIARAAHLLYDRELMNANDPDEAQQIQKQFVLKSLNPMLRPPILEINATPLSLLGPELFDKLASGLTGPGMTKPTARARTGFPLTSKLLFKESPNLIGPKGWINQPKTAELIQRVSSAIEKFESDRRDCILDALTARPGHVDPEVGLTMDALAMISAVEMGNLAHFLSPTRGRSIPVKFRSAYRDSKFFTLLAAENLLRNAEMQNRPLNAKEFAKVQNLLKHLLWYEQYVDHFNLNGAIYSRKELEEIVSGKQSTLRLEDDQLDLNKLSSALEASTLNARNKKETVHDRSVLDASSLTMQIMSQKAGKPLPISLEEADNTIYHVIVAKDADELSQDRKDAALNGLGIIFKRVDSAWDQYDGTQPLREENQQHLHLLWNYIDSVPDHALRCQLIDSLIERLAEIYTERPCHVGVSQRLLDVPSGIDPDMNVFAVQRQVEDEIQSASARLNEVFQAQVVEYAEKCPQGREDQSADDDILREIGMDMAKHRLENQFRTIRGFSKANYGPPMDKAVEGMKYMV